jgi:hypothetical protein
VIRQMPHGPQQRHVQGELHGVVAVLPVVLQEVHVVAEVRGPY